MKKPTGSCPHARVQGDVALGGDCLADIATLRAEPAVFGPVASDPTVSRLIDTLAASGEKALQAIRAARSEVPGRVWSLAGEHAPNADGQVTIGLDGVLVIAHSDKEDAAATWKKTYGHHPLTAFVDHGPGGTGEPVAALLRPGNSGSNTAADHITTAQLALAQLPKKYRRGRQTLIRTGLRRRHPRLRVLAREARPMAVLPGRHNGHRDHSPACAEDPGPGLDPGRRGRRQGP
ncbi:hypothetical protein M2163_000330 [Streptomyces sp. SAI-135]|nr:hypothetical protein [Streptomyces sp. SAI-090]MDH6574049.1 hypothetical protein [Streptomyces sp. SAI-117]MDH6581215.1 hypothetical protein [Streptomyces sp. SAI-133]MDH6613222.1 hypothetical protein [Streptomyces sp. SAI-135]